MPKRTDIGFDAARMARAAASDLAGLGRAMRAAEDSLAGLHRMLKVPNVTPRRRTIKGSTSQPPLLLDALGTFAGSYLAGGIRLSGSSASGNGFNSASASDGSSPSSFYRSAGQGAAELARGLLSGRRIS